MIYALDTNTIIAMLNHSEITLRERDHATAMIFNGIIDT